jgi:hypothetical protein
MFLDLILALRFQVIITYDTVLLPHGKRDGALDMIYHICHYKSVYETSSCEELIEPVVLTD